MERSMMDEKYFGVGGCFVVTKEESKRRAFTGFFLKPFGREGHAPLFVLIPRVL